MSNTKVFDGKFDGTKAIWKVTDEGDIMGDRPIVSLGKKKIKAILDHAEELEKFVNEED